MSATVALVVAAGRGSRFGDALPKQYAMLAGRPVLRHALEAFWAHPRIDAVQVVVHRDDLDLYGQAADGLDLPAPALGGATRQESVRNGLASLAPLRPRAVLIHDGARPFVSAAMIDRAIHGLANADGAIAALPVTDTLKRATDGRVAATLPRADLWGAQTPQAFRYDAIVAAHAAAAGAALTDDAAVAEHAGLTVSLVAGAPENMKITTRDDLARAERWLAGAMAEEVRTGQGFDVHRFTSGDHVMLCGIRVAHDAALAGHSDADVGLHALTDAILGALGEGDIGQHFPPSEARWRGADSSLFVRHAAGLAARRGARIANVDVTLICERPKIGPHRGAMIARVAELLGVAPTRVAIKATTTERLGFTGRGEGIAAQALATVTLPRDLPLASP